MTEDLEARVLRHNLGRERTTRAYKPFELICSEAIDVERKEAIKILEIWNWKRTTQKD